MEKYNATNNTEKAINEAIEVISEGVQELSETKKILFDKKTYQFSIKIPKSLALKARLEENSEFVILVNPKEETIKNIRSKIVIFKKEEKDGERKEGA